MKYLTVDGIEYRVRVVYGSLSRRFEVVEGPNSGTAITAKAIRDILGTGYSYTMNVEPDPAFPQDYDEFYQAITAPVESHVIELPYGQTTMQFEAMVQSGEDSMGATLGGVTRWHGLSVTFVPLRLQREV